MREKGYVIGLFALAMAAFFIVGAFNAGFSAPVRSPAVKEVQTTSGKGVDLHNVNGIDLTKDFRIGGVVGLSPAKERELKQKIVDMVKENPRCLVPATKIKAFNPTAIEPTHQEFYDRSVRGTRAGDVNLTYCEYSVVNQGWANNWDDPDYPGIQGLIGSFMVNKPGTITVHVTNGDSAPANVQVRLVIKDFYE